MPIRFIEHNSIIFYKAIKTLANSHEKQPYVLVLIMKMFINKFQLWYILFKKH